MRQSCAHDSTAATDAILVSRIDNYTAFVATAMNKRPSLDYRCRLQASVAMVFNRRDGKIAKMRS